MDTSSKVVAACVVAFGALLVSEIQARLNPLSGSGRRGAIRAGGAGHEPPPPFAADIPEGKNLTVGVGTFGGGGSAPLFSSAPFLAFPVTLWALGADPQEG